MKQTFDFGKCVVSICLIFVLVLCNPICAFAQSQQARNYILNAGTPVVLKVPERFNSKGKAETGVIQAVVDSDVYSADGTTILISAGTPALIEFNADANGAWGKAGKICMTNATTRTVDNKRISLRLSACEKGGSKIGGVIALSVLFFPIGLISGCMKGSMPKIPAGTIFNATTTQDIACEIISE